jgi:hypothetical protein
MRIESFTVINKLPLLAKMLFNYDIESDLNFHIIFKANCQKKAKK